LTQRFDTKKNANLPNLNLSKTEAELQVEGEKLKLQNRET